jgi:hypothetical protein
MKIKILNQPRTVGLNSRKPGVSLTKFPVKGYPAIWTVGSDLNGPDLKKKEGGGAPTGEDGHAVARHHRRRPSSPAQAETALEAPI